MQYSDNMIEQAKADAGRQALVYIEELETRLKLMAQVAGGLFEAAKEDASDAVVMLPIAQISQEKIDELGTNGLGDTIGLHFEPDEEIGPRVTWFGLAGYETVDFSTRTIEEAKALYVALLSVNNIECD